MMGRVSSLIVALLVASTVLLYADDEIRVVTLVRDGHVLVSFTLGNGLNQEIRDAIRSGLPTTISYEVELRRTVPVWFDTTIGSVTVTASARYDNLRRLHQLARTIDGRGEEPHVTDNEDTVREWMTVFERLPLFDTKQLEPNAEYYVRVRARSRPHLVWFLWPWDRGWATGNATFTFVQ